MDGPICTKEDLFFSIKNSELPLDPPLTGIGNWDALEDSLGAGLISMDVVGFLVTWWRFEKFKQNSPNEWDTALDILSNLSVQTSRLKILLLTGD